MQSVCTLHYADYTLEGVLLDDDGKVGRCFILKSPKDASFWLTLPHEKLECKLNVKDVFYEAIFSVASTIPVHTIGNTPPRKLVSITGKIIDENFKLV